MENFRKRYDKKDLEIINISLCFNEEDAVKFLKEKVKVELFNAHLQDWKKEEGYLKDFEIKFIPRTILVDEEGNIICINNLEEMMSILDKS